VDQTGSQTIRDNISPLVLVEPAMKMVFIAGFMRGSDGEKSLEPAYAYSMVIYRINFHFPSYEFEIETLESYRM